MHGEILSLKYKVEAAEKRNRIKFHGFPIAYTCKRFSIFCFSYIFERLLNMQKVIVQNMVTMHLEWKYPVFGYSLDINYFAPVASPMGHCSHAIGSTLQSCFVLFRPCVQYSSNSVLFIRTFSIQLKENDWRNSQ